MSFNHYYQSELTALRQLGKRFAERSPALAPFLGQSGRNPDVERLLEGFAFLTGRLRQKLGDELPELTHSLMHLLWPNYMRPLPAFSMLHLAQYQRQVQVASLRSDHDPLSLNFAIEGRREVDDLHRQVSFAAHQSASTACPVPGHGTNPIAAGSPDVLFDGLPAARMRDASACGGALSGNVIPTVLINGKPAAVLGSVGSHGNVVVGGSGTVLIGTSGGGATIGPVAPVSFVASAVAAIVDALVPGAEAAEKKSEALDYRLELKSGGNRILTPLEIPDYDELASGTTKNREAIDFLVINREQPADSLTLEVLDGSTLIYAEADTAKLLPTGEHPWQWDGYSLAGVLDTKVLKSAALKVRLTAVKGGLRQIVELPLANESQEVDWVDARVDRSTKMVEVTVRPSFSDGGIKGKNSNLTPLTYPALEAQAKKGIEHYWSRNGTRTQGIAGGINTRKGLYLCTVQADVNAIPSAKNFPLTENLTVDGGRSTSLSGFRVIHHNSGYWQVRRYSAVIADEEFMHTAAHEFGHLVLNEYGDGGLVPHYSWSHKDTSTVLTQNRKYNHYIPATGELDVMHYFTDYPVGEAAHLDFWDRSSISEQDVKGLLWLTRVEFND